MEALVTHQTSYKPLQLSCVVADSPCPGLQYVQAHTDLPTLLLDYKSRPSEALEAELVTFLQAHQIEAVLVNYNHMLGPVVLSAFEYRLFNHHMALLPSFKGFKAPKKAYEHSTLFAGSSIHRVTPEMDEGPIISQVVLAKDPKESFDAFCDRHVDHSIQLCLDFLVKLALEPAMLEGDQPYFEHATYGTMPFNPALSSK